jgi:hypothetical protein
MAEDIIVFDAARVPFVKGTSLVEASAGTGKTYAIGMLVLRGVVELGIPIEKILIVTFTSTGCLFVYHFVIRRVKILRPLFGLKYIQL